MSQPDNWRSAGPLTTGTDATFGGTRLDDKDESAIAEAVETVRVALAKAREADKDRPTLLYLGVGAGNPMGAWKNPSGSPRFDADAAQVSPPLIADAVSQGYFVIGLNFNVDSATKPTELAADAGIHLHVTAKFPLGDTGEPRGSLLLLRNLAAECDLVAVLNAVSNHAYPGLVTLAVVHSSNKAVGAAQRIRSVYALSYAESGEQVVVAPVLNGKMSYTKNTGLSSVAAVFPTLDQLPD